MLKGIDISHWQENLDIAATGAEFVICKATQGTTFVDPSCDRHYQLAKKLGKKLGVYHYASGGDPVAEADFFVKNIQGYIGEAILILDWESKQNARFSEHASWCLKFLNRVKELTGVKPLIYMSASVLKQANWNSVVEGDYGLWIAAWPDLRDSWDVPEFTYSFRPWPFYAIWQYTDSGGRLDRDVFMGDAAAWDKYANPSGNINIQVKEQPADTKEEPVYYTVKKGDTLWGIAQQFGTTYQKIAELSGIPNPDYILPGQKVRVK